MKQILGNPKVTPLKGVFTVLLVVFSICLLYVIMYFVRLKTGFRYGTFVVWAVGFGMAAWMLVNVVRAWEYAADESMLVICRLYGKRRRLFEQIVLRKLRDAGDPAEMKKEWGVRPSKAVVRSSPYEPLCLVYETDGKLRAVTIMPEPELKEKLLSYIPRLKK